MSWTAFCRQSSSADKCRVHSLLGKLLYYLRVRWKRVNKPGKKQQLPVTPECADWQLCTLSTTAYEDTIHPHTKNAGTSTAARVHHDVVQLAPAPATADLVEPRIACVWQDYEWCTISVTHVAAAVSCPAEKYSRTHDLLPTDRPSERSPPTTLHVSATGVRLKVFLDAKSHKQHQRTTASVQFIPTAICSQADA